MCLKSRNRNKMPTGVIFKWENYIGNLVKPASLELRKREYGMLPFVYNLFTY